MESELRLATSSAEPDRQLWVPQLYLSAIKQFEDHAKRQIERVRKNFNSLSDDDKASLVRDPEQQVGRVAEAASTNEKFLAKLVELFEKASALVPADTRQPACVPSGKQPVQNLLHSFVREWSADGEAERKDCFEKLLTALDGHAKASGTKLRVLLPCAALGRLGYEVQCRGHVCEASEGRMLHFLGAALISQHVEKESLDLQPFATNTCNRFHFEDHVRRTPVPDVDVQPGLLPATRFGEFARLYGTAAAFASFDVLLTAFAIDSSANVFRFVRTAAHAVKIGGLWANFGGLAHDTDHDEARGHGLELSWEELRFAISQFFDIQEEEFVDAYCASNSRSMMAMQYNCIYFKAVRNGNPSLGIGA